MSMVERPIELRLRVLAVDGWRDFAVPDRQLALAEAAGRFDDARCFGRSFKQFKLDNRDNEE
jgi:hypothetical protein